MWKPIAVPNKSVPPEKPKRRRASARFSATEDFDAALDAAAHRQVGEALHRRSAQMNIDDLVLRAIRAANSVGHDLPPAEFAKVVTAMLVELVAGRAVAGELPSDTRLQSIVLRHVKTSSVGNTGDDDPIRSIGWTE